MMKKIPSLCIASCLCGMLLCAASCSSSPRTDERAYESVVRQAEQLREAARLADHVEVRLNMCYGNRTCAGAGVFLKDCFYYDFAIDAGENKQLRQLVARLKPVPQHTPADAAWPIGKDADSSGGKTAGMVSLRLVGASQSIECEIDDIQCRIVSETEARSGKGRYYLPDADYKALMSLPSIRKAYAWREKYRDNPPGFFRCAEDDARMRGAESIREALAEPRRVLVRLDMYYPHLDPHRDAPPPLFFPYVSLRMPQYYTIIKAERRSESSDSVPEEAEHFSMGAAELKLLRKALSRIEPMPVLRHAAGEAAADESDGCSVYLLVDDEMLDLERELARKSQAKSARVRKTARFALPDADYASLMALPSIRKAMQYRREYRKAPAGFFIKREM